MAGSARELLWLTELQIWLGAAGALLLFVALIYTARSTRAAIASVEIAAETHRVAVAGLGRPYIFIESVSHNFGDWRSGKEQLRFFFRLTNHGGSPAMIKTIFAYATLSHGPDSAPENEPTPRPFPEKDRLLQTIGPPWSTVFMCPTAGGGEPEKVKGFVLRAGETSRRFESPVPYPPLQITESALGWQVMREMYEMTGFDGPVRPWLFVHVYYETPFGSGHITNFCALGFSDGGILEYEEEPYSQHT